MYDRKRYLHRFIKLKFKSWFTSELWNVKRIKVDSNYFNQFNGIIFVFYNETDIVDFLNCYNKEINILVCSEDDRILNNFLTIPNVEIININFLKCDLYNILSKKTGFLFLK